MRIRWKKFALWSVGGILAAAGITAALLLWSPLPTVVLRSVLSHEIKQLGGSLTVSNSSGSLSEGMVLQGVALKIPGKLDLSARRVDFRMDIKALIVGVVRVRRMSVDGPDLQVFSGEAGKGGAPGKGLELPLWLTVSAPSVRVADGKISIRRGGGKTTFSQVDGVLGLGIYLGRVHLDTTSLHLKAPQLLPETLVLSGRAEMWGRRLRTKMSIRRGAAVSRVQGLLETGGPKGPEFKGTIIFTHFPLDLIAPLWPEVPRLLLHGESSLFLSGDAVRWKGWAESGKLGRVAAEGLLRYGKGGIKARGSAQTGRLSPSVLFPALAGRSIRLAGHAKWTLTKPADGELRWTAAGEGTGGTVAGISYEDLRFKAAGSRAEGGVTGEVLSEPTGKAAFRLGWKEGGAAWQFEFGGKKVRVPGLLKKLDLWPAMPEGLHAPAGPWTVSSASLVRDYSGYRLKASLGTPSGGAMEVRAERQPQPARLSWTMDVNEINPASWGIRAAGRVNAALRFQGVDAGRGRLVIVSRASTLGKVEVEPSKIVFHLKPGLIRCDPFTLKTSVGNATLSGRLKGSRGGFIHAAFSIPDVKAVGALTGLNFAMRGSLQGEVSLDEEGGLRSVRGSVSGRSLRFENWTAGQAFLSGAWSPREGSTALRAHWTGLQTGDTTLGAGRVQLGGSGEEHRLLFSVEAGQGRKVSGEGEAFVSSSEASLKLTSLKLSLSKDSLSLTQTAHLSWDGKRLKWYGFSMTGQHAGKVSFSGNLDLSGGWGKATLAGKLQCAELPLQIVPLPQTAGSIGGRMSADLSWQGSPDQPELDGWLKVTSGFYRYANSDLVVTPINLNLAARGNRLILKEGTATTSEGGKTVASGFVQFSGFLPAQISLKARGEHFPFVLGTHMSAEADFQVGFTGSVVEPVVTGRANIIKGRIQLPDMIQEPPLPATIRFVNRPAGKGGGPPGGKEEPEALFSRLRGRIHLESVGGLWVSNRNLLAEVQGTLDVDFTAAGPRLTGTVSLLNGRYLFQGRKFDIQESHLYFSGDSGMSPELDVNALYHTTVADVTIHLTGKPERPVLKFSSTPPRDEADILSVILFGTPRSDLTAGQNQAWSSTAAAVVALYQTGPVLESFKQGLGLDTLNVGTSPTGAAEVGFSKYLNDKTVLEYHQTFGALPERRVDLRYRINRRLSLQTESESRGNTGVDLLWEKRY